MSYLELIQLHACSYVDKAELKDGHGDFQGNQLQISQVTTAGIQNILTS